MADVNRILQIKMIGDGLQIIGIVVHVMSVAGLTRATMSAAISRNDAVAFAEEKKHLRVPIIRRERPAVTEDNRLPAAPVFIIDVDVRSVLFSDGHVWHKRLPFSLSCTKQSATLDRINPTEFFSLLHSLSTLRLCDAKSVGRARLREQVRTAAEKFWQCAKEAASRAPRPK